MYVNLKDECRKCRLFHCVVLSCGIVKVKLCLIPDPDVVVTWWGLGWAPELSGRENYSFEMRWWWTGGVYFTNSLFKWLIWNEFTVIVAFDLIKQWHASISTKSITRSMCPSSKLSRTKNKKNSPLMLYPTNTLPTWSYEVIDIKWI